MILNLKHLKTKIRYKRRGLLNSTNYHAYNDAHKIKLFKDITIFIQNMIDKLQIKISMRNVLSRQCSQYFIKLAKKIEFDQKNLDTQLNITIKDRYINVYENITAVKNILNQDINFQSGNFDLKIKNKISEIYRIIYKISIENSFDFNIKHLVLILFYFDYQIKQYVIYLTTIQNNSLNLSEHSDKSYMYKLNKLLIMLRIEKKNISLLSKSVCTGYFKSIRYKDICDFLLISNQIFLYFIEADAIYDTFLCVIISKKTNTQIQQDIIFEFLLKISNLKNLFVLEFDDLDFLYLQTYCFFILRLFSLYTLLENKPIHIQKNVIDMIEQHIKQITHIFNRIENVEKNKQKIHFLKVIIDKNQKNLFTIINFGTYNYFNEKEKLIKNIFFEEWLFEIKLYDICNEICTNKNFY
ncbi:hypothetical protein NUSPORA_02556 [Nucleospora cyclopteri]